VLTRIAMLALCLVGNAPIGHAQSGRAGPDLRGVFEAAIMSLHPHVPFVVKEEPTSGGGSPIYVATFEVRTPDSFQAIALSSDGGKVACARQALRDAGRLIPMGFGPGGSAFALRFCVNGGSFTLVNLNSLSAADVEHGIALGPLAGLIRKALAVRH
jgi:hypothetical protein